MQVSTQNDYQAKQQARAFTAKQLQAAHPHLIPNSGISSRIAAAKNIRIELKRAFPEIKFSVTTKTFSMGNSLSVRWIDGPNSAQVDSIINKYQAGSFDGMTDCYNYANSAWTDAFGDAKYVHSNRDYSDRAIASAIRTVAARYAGNLREIIMPTIEDFRMGRAWQTRVPGIGDELQSLINRELARRTWAIGCAPAVRV